MAYPADLRMTQKQGTRLPRASGVISVAMAAVIAWFSLREHEKRWTFEHYGNRSLDGEAMVGELIAPDIDSEDPLLADILADDSFSMRLKSCLQVLRAGRYQFRVSADNGARLYLNGELVADAWKDGQATTGKNVELVSGSYPIMIEYYDAGGAARMRVEMSQAGVHTFRSLRSRTKRPLNDGTCSSI